MRFQLENLKNSNVLLASIWDETIQNDFQHRKYKNEILIKGTLIYIKVCIKTSGIAT